MDHLLVFNLKQLILDLSAKNGREYQIKDIAEATGLTRFTISAVVNNTAVRVDLATLSKLYRFFHDEGLKITPGQLLTLGDS